VRGSSHSWCGPRPVGMKGPCLASSKRRASGATRAWNRSARTPALWIASMAKPPLSEPGAISTPSRRLVGNLIFGAGPKNSACRRERKTT
jgi:hypothetical protein